MSENRHNIFVVLDGPFRGELVRTGAWITSDVVMVRPVEGGDAFRAYKDDLQLVGCVDQRLWECQGGIEYEAASFVREAVRRTVDHFLDNGVAGRV